MGHSEKIFYSDVVSENEGRKFNRELIKDTNVYIQHTLKTLKKKNTRKAKPCLFSKMAESQ